MLDTDPSKHFVGLQDAFKTFLRHLKDIFVTNQCWLGYLMKSSRQRCSIKMAVLKNFAIFTRKNRWTKKKMKKMLDSFYNKLDLIKERLQRRCVLVNIAKFLRKPFWRTSANGCFYLIQQSTGNFFNQGNHHVIINI